MISENALPAVANDVNIEDSGIGINGGDASPPITTTRSAGHTSTVKRTVKREDGIKVPTTTTRIKVDTTKMTSLCERLEGTLMQLVDDTREDDLFITRLQEELVQSEQNWDHQISKIAEEVVESKNQLAETVGNKQLDTLKDELAALKERQTAADKEKEDLQFKLRMKRVKMEQLNEEMVKVKEQMKDEQEWRDKVHRQMEAVQKSKLDTDKATQDTMIKVSSDIFKYRNKRVPEAGDLKDLHELVDRVHHNIGYLMMLGQPYTNNGSSETLNEQEAREAASKAEQMAKRKSSFTSAL